MPATSPRRLETAQQLSIEVATTSQEIEEAQRLRYRVFVGELGARAQGCPPEHEKDFFDPWCEHLLVRDRPSGRVVGTHRILTAKNARRIGTFCAEREFDLTRLASLRAHLVEIGRACIDPDFRGGPALAMLWGGIARFVRERGGDYLIGCASISMADGGQDAMAVYEHLAPAHLAPIEYRVFPRSPLEVIAEQRAHPPVVSPLLRAYLRAGAWIGGEPAWDPDFNTADLLLFLPFARVEARGARHDFAERRAA